MYNFIDVTEVSEGALPSEALNINGEYIENQIKGYRTLNVTGREALSPDVESFETGHMDGTRLKRKRYPERIITVRYQLVAGSNEEFRDAYNKLGQILDVENARLIFDDEPDKFFIGTPCVIDSVDAGTNAVTGNFEILCTDPFKYSVVEYEAIPALDESSVLIDYHGTYKAFPVLEADFYEEDDGTGTALTGNGDCGYVAFFTEDEKIVQLGNPDEVDGSEAYEKSQTLVNQTFLSDTAWGTTAKALWTVNAGDVLPADVVQTGDVAMAISEYEETVNSDAATSGTLFQGRSTASTPYFDYAVTARATERTANTVNLYVAVTASLANAGSYFGRGYGLTVSVYAGGAWHDATLKTTSEYWKGQTGHTVNLAFTVSGLSETDTALTGIRFKATRTDGIGQAGTVSDTACNSMPITAYSARTASGYYLTASDYGSGTGYHGASICRNIGADAAGETGAANFIFTYKQKMCIGKNTNDTAQLGGFHSHLSTDDGTVVAGVRIVKNTAGKNASLMLFVNGAKVHQVGIDMSHYNKWFGASDSAPQTSTIRKEGARVTFNIAGYVQSFVDDAIESLKVTKVTFMFEKYASNTPLSFNGLFYAKFTKNNCTTFRNVPNKFSANDVVEADCKNGEILLNGIPTPDLGALGNDWEGFVLTPGLNQIGIAYSNWVQDDYKPTFKVRYREVFL